ncbi:MAG: hypothetical protein SFW62_02570 [Alphaproteobacteria bacterium]|nr:hypothetical protein [Alphaproteobacteria bacterium]
MQLSQESITRAQKHGEKTFARTIHQLKEIGADAHHLTEGADIDHCAIEARKLLDQEAGIIEQLRQAEDSKTLFQRLDLTGGICFSQEQKLVGILVRSYVIGFMDSMKMSMRGLMQEHEAWIATEIPKASALVRGALDFADCGIRDGLTEQQAERLEALRGNLALALRYEQPATMQLAALEVFYRGLPTIRNGEHILSCDQAFRNDEKRIQKGVKKFNPAFAQS